jgi:chromate transporter
MAETEAPKRPPSLAALFWCFTVIGMQSFGGGLSSWMRREVVQKRRWVEDPPFLSGMALAQITPGANAVNLAVFLGTTLRGGAGAVAALAGLMALPVVLILAVGALYFSGRQLPGVETALGGLGAAAIGLNLATGIRLAGRNVRRVRQGLVMAAVILAIGVFQWPLLPVLVVTVPASLLIEHLAGA